jgi:hypothetical protein
MPIRVSTPGGASIEFPDGTPPDVITRTMQQAMGHQGQDAEQQPDASMLESAGRGALQGATFGFSDEIWGGLKGGYDTLANGGNFIDNYAHVRDETRAANERAQRANPGTYLAGEIAGGVAGPGGIAGAATRLGLRGGERIAARSLAERIRRGSAAGAGYGAAYGFGTAEGDPVSQLGSTAAGAASGAAMGAALPPLVDAASAVGSRLMLPIRGALNPEAVGREKLAEALMRDRSPGGRPDFNVLDAILPRLDRARASQPDVMLADMGGENTRNLMRSAANMAGTGAQRLNRTLDARQANQWRQIEKSMSRGIGNPSDYAASVDQIVAMRDAAAGPLFKSAMRVPIKADDQLISVLHRPGMQDILKRTAAKMQNEGADPNRALPMELLHRSKMEIDKAISEVKSGQSNTAGWDVRTLTKMKHDLLDAIDNPTYKQALKISAGENALKNAAEDGFDEALKLPTEDLAKRVRSFSNDSERDMYRLGASRALAGKIRSGNVMRDRTEGLFSSPDIQLRLKAIFPSQGALREFQRDLVLQAKKADTRKAVQGNSTTAKQLMNAEEAGQPVAMLSAAAHAGSGQLTPLFAHLSRVAQRFSGLTPRSANAIIEAGMSRDPAVLSALREADAVARRSPGRRDAISQAIVRGGLVGQTPYRPLFDTGQ